MRKNLIPVIIPFVFGLFFYSCSELILPKEIEVKGSLKLPVKIGSSSFSTIFAKVLEDAFSDGKEEVYDVDYGQDFLAFCIYIPIKITESLNPTDYMEDINNSQIPEINQAIQIPAFDNLTFSIPVSYTFPAPLTSGTNITIPPFDIDVFPTDFPLDMDADFLHALIGTGNFSIDLDLSEGNIILDKIITTNDIVIKQNNDSGSVGISYSGLFIHAVTPTDSLAGKDINKENVSVSGTIRVESQPGGATVTVNSAGAQDLKGRLIIKINIDRLDKVDWDFRNISASVQDIAISLANTAQHVNYLKYDQCNGSADTGIGLNFNFTEIIDGLALTVECGELGIPNTTKPITQGDNIFGNQSEFTLYLEYNPFLDFKLTLESNNDPVLQLANLTPGETLRLNGKAVLFQNWIEAEINMVEIMRAQKHGDVFYGQYPDPKRNEKTIDLSLMQNHLDGFEFQGVKSNTYLSGPIGAVEEHHSLISLIAHYDGGIPLDIYPQGPMKLDKERIILKDNPDYLNDENAYKREDLPDGGHHTEFSEVMNAHPDNVVFTYEVTDMPDAIVVTPEMFTDDENNNLFATVIIMLPMKLLAGENGGKIKYPDMFKGKTDLFGRDSVDDDSLFSSAGISYIKLYVDFDVAFFQNGYLFLEKENEERLFPDGIELDGKQLAINIAGDDIEIIKDNLIPPGFRINFDPYATVAIPRNIGLTSVKFEAKGTYELEL